MATSTSTDLPPSRLISSAQVSGTAVYDLRGERLGHIDDVMIDKPSGRVAYAVLAIGSFLGLNDKLHPLPWSALHYDVALDGYVIDLHQNTLKRAPAYGIDTKPDWGDQGWGKVDDYYGASPTDQDIPLDATSPAR
jgi:hypothetical protein